MDSVTNIADSEGGRKGQHQVEIERESSFGSNLLHVPKRISAKV